MFFKKLGLRRYGFVYTAIYKMYNFHITTSDVFIL